MTWWLKQWYIGMMTWWHDVMKLRRRLTVWYNILYNLWDLLVCFLVHCLPPRRTAPHHNHTPAQLRRSRGSTLHPPPPLLLQYCCHYHHLNISALDWNALDISAYTEGGVGAWEAGGGVGGAVGRGWRHQPCVHRVLWGQGILQRRQEKSRYLCDLQQNWSVFYILILPSPARIHFTIH